MLLISLHESAFITPLLEGSGLPFEITATRQGTWGRGANDVCHIYLLQKSTISMITTQQKSDITSHFLRVQNHWFQDLDPLLTPERERELSRDFGEEPGRTRSLAECYDILFTSVERELFSFVDFTEDFDVFREDRPDVGRDSMTLEQALDFLRKMQ